MAAINLQIAKQAKLVVSPVSSSWTILLRALHGVGVGGGSSASHGGAAAAPSAASARLGLCCHRNSPGVRGHAVLLISEREEEFKGFRTPRGCECENV